jgi:hypothetical protein
VWGSEWEHAQRALRRTGEAAQLPGLQPQLRYDIWGRPLRYSDTFGSPATDFAWNLLSPVKVKDADNAMKADLALARYNATHPDDRQAWSEPLRFVTDKGERRALSDQQYADYAKLSGEIARYAVEQLNVDHKNPSTDTIAAVGNILRRSREAAREALLPAWRNDWGTGDGQPVAAPDPVAVGGKLLTAYATSRISTGIAGRGRPELTQGESQEDYSSRLAEWQAKRTESLRWLDANRDAPALQTLLTPYRRERLAALLAQ